MLTRTSPLVLIVDDDAAVLGALTFALSAEGYRVRACESAQAALDAVAQNAPACLVVDYRLPDMDGIALIGHLRRTGVRSPAILVTSNPDPRCRARARATGAVIVEKPLLGDALSREIENLLR